MIFQMPLIITILKNVYVSHHQSDFPRSCTLTIFYNLILNNIFITLTDSSEVFNIILC